MRLVAVTGHTRLARRGAVYYHRAAIPQDIKDSYPKAEETFSHKTKDRAVALRLVRLAAVEVDRRFEAHRRKIRGERIGVQDELTPDQVAAAKAAYYRYLLDEDEDIRLDGFVELDDEGRVIGELPEAPAPTFEEHGQAAEDLAASTRYEYARGKTDDFWQGEADEEIVGDKPVTEYGNADGLRFKSVLMQLPPNVAKSKALRKLSYADAAEKAVALGMAPMSISNYNKALLRVGSFFRWAEPNTVGTVTNPVNGLRMAEQKSAVSGTRLTSPGGRSPSGGLRRVWRFS